MILAYKNIELNVELFSDFSPENQSILFLHGFTGSVNDWREVAQKINPAFNIVALDTIGHGKSSSPVDVELYRTDELIKQILFITDYYKIEKVILSGYSMGGRAALNFASAHPEKISAVILESASAGIQNEDERKSRVIRDEQLAYFIESHSVEDFINKWMEMELFKSQKIVSDEKLRNLKAAKLKNSTTGLANSLKGFGTGVMPYLGNEIKKMDFPVLLVSGELDSKFTQLNSELVKQFPDADHIIVDGAGHNIHFESPDDYNSKLNHFLKQF